MSFLCNVFSKNIFSASSVLLNSRSISIFPTLHIKNIKEIQNDKELTIYGEYISSPREPYLLKNESCHACPVCASGLNIKHTDIRIVSQFVRSDGCMLPRRITKLCRKQHRYMSALVTMAQKAGLMPNLNPANSNKDPKKRYEWKKFNKYFDESTLKC